eukprot:15455938-Alexandrium_andersonii.AAC.1
MPRIAPGSSAWPACCAKVFGNTSGWRAWPAGWTEVPGTRPSRARGRPGPEGVRERAGVKARPACRSKVFVKSPESSAWPAYCAEVLKNALESS